MKGNTGWHTKPAFKARKWLKKGGKKAGDRWRESTRKGKNGGNGDEGRAKNTDKNIQNGNML